MRYDVVVIVSIGTQNPVASAHRSLRCSQRIMVRAERKSKTEIARFLVLRVQNPAISNQPKPRKRTHIQLLSRCSRPTKQLLSQNRILCLEPLFDLSGATKIAITEHSSAIMAR